MKCVFGGADGGGAKMAKQGAIRDLFPTAQSDGQYTPLHEACQKSDLNKVQKICKCKTELQSCVRTRDCLGNIPLYYAVESNSTEIVQLLLEKCPNLLKTDDQIENKYNSMILQLAIENLNLDIMDHLLQGGCPVNMKTRANAMVYNWTPLQFTCNFVCSTMECGKSTRNHPVLKIVKKLLKHKADAMIKDDIERTALHIVLAVQSGTNIHGDVASLILDHGGGPQSENQRASFLNLAVRRGNFEIVKKLVEEHKVSVIEVSLRVANNNFVV